MMNVKQLIKVSAKAGLKYGRSGSEYDLGFYNGLQNLLDYFGSRELDDIVSSSFSNDSDYSNGLQDAYKLGLGL